MHVRLVHQPTQIPANSSVKINDTTIGGFFCTAGGVVTITGTSDLGATTPIVTFTATANTWYDLPFYIGPQGGNITTDATAAGTLAS